MKDSVADNPFAGSREMAEAGAGFIAYLNDRFPNAQALVDAIEDILSELCLNLTNLTDAFNTGSPEFEEKHGEHILVIKRYQVLSEPDWLKNYLSPTLFPYLLSLWKDEHTNEEAKLEQRVLKRKLHIDHATFKRITLTLHMCDMINEEQVTSRKTLFTLKDAA